jgi:hypothetical protein
MALTPSIRKTENSVAAIPSGLTDEAIIGSHLAIPRGHGKDLLWRTSKDSKNLFFGRP